MNKYLLIVILGLILGGCNNQKTSSESTDYSKANEVEEISKSGTETTDLATKLESEVVDSEKQVDSPSAQEIDMTDKAKDKEQKKIKTKKDPIEPIVDKVDTPIEKKEVSKESKVEVSKPQAPISSKSNKEILDETNQGVPKTEKPEITTTAKEVDKSSTAIDRATEKIADSISTRGEQLPVATNSSAEEKPESKPEEPRQAQSKPMHSFFNSLLSTYVSDQGKVNYAGISSDIEKLEKYIAELQKFPPKDDWTKSESLAYWINAYNAFTIKLICDNYPVSSIKDLHSGKPWDHKWIKIDGETLSLNDIENGIIRPDYNEPRIHFAVNCAAKSCPPIANQAYTRSNLDVLLEKRTKSFINNAIYNDLTKNPAMVSKIFDWYKDDFSDVVAYINKYIYDGVKPIASVDYMEYDWSLNN